MDNELAAPASIGSILNKTPDPTHISDQVSYFFIKNVKRWMECPLCGEEMHFNKTTETWECESGDFLLPEKEFLDGYVFWFCDQCGCFLNVQEGFAADAGCWTCTECGFENNVTEENLVGACRECGRLLDNPDASLCPDCNEAWLATHPKAAQ